MTAAPRARRRYALLLPWFLLIAVLVGCVLREMAWRGKMNELAELEQLLGNVSRAADADAERAAMERLGTWTERKAIAVSISAYSPSTGESTAIRDLAGKTGSDTAFELGFDCDRNMTPERTYHMCLKIPSHVTSLMHE